MRLRKSIRREKAELERQNKHTRGKNSLERWETRRTDDKSTPLYTRGREDSLARLEQIKGKQESEGAREKDSDKTGCGCICVYVFTWYSFQSGQKLVPKCAGGGARAFTHTVFLSVENIIVRLVPRVRRPLTVLQYWFSATAIRKQYTGEKLFWRLYFLDIFIFFLIFRIIAKILYSK